MPRPANSMLLISLPAALALLGCNSTGPSEEVVPPPPPAILDATWTTTASTHQASVGSSFQYRCPANGTLNASIWGTVAYTDDSAICVAAVHAGQIGVAQGGVVTITIRPGYGNYVSTSRAGVVSQPYGPWTGSFSFGPVEATATTWAANAAADRGKNDQVFIRQCPANGTASTVWGTDIYTDDSSVCTAAVHQGAISLAKGGVVFVRIVPGRSAYAGSSRNGVISRSWSSYLGSFRFD